MFLEQTDPGIEEANVVIRGEDVVPKAPYFVSLWTKGTSTVGKWRHHGLKQGQHETLWNELQAADARIPQQCQVLFVCMLHLQYLVCLRQLIGDVLFILRFSFVKNHFLNAAFCCQ